MDEQIDKAFVKFVREHNLLGESVLDHLREKQEELLQDGEHLTLFAIACQIGILSQKQGELIGEAIQRTLATNQQINKHEVEAIRGRDDSSGRRITGDRQHVILAGADGEELPEVAGGRVRSRPERAPRVARPSDRPRGLHANDETDVRPEESAQESGGAAPIRALVGLIGVVALLGIIVGVAVFVYLRSAPEGKVDEAKLAYDELMSRIGVEDLGDEALLEELRTYSRRFPTSEYAAEFDSRIKELKIKIRQRAANKVANDISLKAGRASTAELRAIRSEIEDFLKKNPKTKHTPRMLGLLKDIKRRIRNAELDERWKSFYKPIEKIAAEDSFGVAFKVLEQGKEEFGELKRYQALSNDLKKQAKRRYQEIASSGRNRAAAGDLEGAIKVYESIAGKFGLPEYVERAYRDIAKLREGAKLPRMKQFAAAQAANRKARIDALQGNLEPAVSALRSFANEAADSSAEDVEMARERARVLSDVPTFAAAVAEGINLLVGKRYKVKRASGIRFTGKVLRADAESFDIRVESRTLTVRWDELEPGIIMRLGVGAYPGAMIDGWPAGIAWLVVKGAFDSARSHLSELQEKSSRTLMTKWVYEWEEDAALYKPAMQYFGTKDLAVKGKWDIKAATSAVCDGKGSLTVTKQIGPAYRFKASLCALDQGASFSISLPAGDSGLVWKADAAGHARVMIAGAKSGKLREHKWELAPFEKFEVEVRLYGGKYIAFLDGSEVWKIGAEGVSRKNKSKITIKVTEGSLEINDPVIVEYRNVTVKPKKRR
ncbi:MAG: hypothetical protein E3J72_14605 [Planctomycetota bacterium]|nr:MAG: hypothetical protein E3J72_14605 [Planctomycetota bacterium]